jgi:hypothetical protein
MSEINYALSDIELIRQIVDGDKKNRSKSELRTEAAILLVLLAVNICFLAFEYTFTPSLSDSFMSLKGSREIQVEGIAELFVALLIVAAGLYYLAFRRAKELESSLGRTLKRSLTSLQLQSILPDLSLKFTLLCIVILGDYPELIGSMLVAFVADWILQGRFFRLAIVVRTVAGLGAIVCAIGMAVINFYSITPALIIFTCVCILSLIQITVEYRAKR